jgi:FixJ family two-component response regulator
MSEDTIYVIDDNEAVCHAIKFLFDSFLNIDVKTYLCPHSFLKEFSSNHQGCIIVDLDMPSMSGIELMEQAKKINKEIHFIVISGHGDSNAEAQSMEAGAHVFILKPFKAERLLDEVKSVLKIGA